MPFDESKLTPAQEEQLAKLQKAIDRYNLALSRGVPEHVKELGEVIRRSLGKKSLVEFRRFLREHGYQIMRKDLEDFRDFLIINRPDLKDLEPQARARLRARTLLADKASKMTKDYRQAAASGVSPRCRDCRYFVNPPNDGEDNSDKSCVQMGTKGADLACYGFTLRPS